MSADKKLNPDLARDDANTPNIKPVQKGLQKPKMKSINSIQPPEQILGRPAYASSDPCPKDSSNDCPSDSDCPKDDR